MRSSRNDGIPGKDGDAYGWVGALDELLIFEFHTLAFQHPLQFLKRRTTSDFLNGDNIGAKSADIFTYLRLCLNRLSRASADWVFEVILQIVSRYSNRFCKSGLKLRPNKNRYYP